VRKEKLRNYTIIFLLLFLLAGVFHALDSSSIELFGTFAYTANFVIYLYLIVLWIRSVYERLLPSYTRRYMIVEAIFMLIFIILRTIKYRIVQSPCGIRVLWYLYYVPIVMIPTFFLISAISFGNTVDEEKKGVSLRTGRVKISFFIWFFSVIIIGIVLTNDFNELVFIPSVPLSEFSGEEGTYSYGLTFYGIYAWVIAAVIIGVIYLIWLTGKVSKWHNIIYILIPIILVPIISKINIYADEHDMWRLYHDPELFVFALIIILEICLRNRLISYNEDYPGIFGQMNIHSVITDSNYKVKYKTEAPLDITEEEMRQSLSSPVYLDEDTKLLGMKIRAGYVFWTVDESEINRINGSLEEANETLNLENKLIQYELDQKEERSRIDARNVIYRKAAITVYKEQKQIETLLGETSPGKDDFKEKVAVVSLLNAFVKRKSNFVLTYSEDEYISSREIYLAIEEMIRFTGYFGVLGSVENVSRASFSYKDTLSLYDTFLLLLEKVIGDITKLLVVIDDHGFRVIMDYSEELDIPSDDWNISTDRDGESLYVTVSSREGGENG